MSPTRDRASHRRRDRAAALVVALAVLALFAVFAVSVGSLMRLERAAAGNHVLGVRARLLARAGFHRATAELGRTELREPFPTALGARWRYSDATGTRPGHGIPIEQAKVGSFEGALGGTFRTAGDRYVLKVIDAGSQVHLGLPGERLAPMLDVLGRAIARERAARGEPAIDPVAGRGARIVALRDALGGIARKEQLTELLSTEELAALADYVSVHAWVDPSTSAPEELVPEHGVPLMRSQPRAPINVNTAPRPVLVAALAGLALPGAPAIDERQAEAIADELIRYRDSGIVGEGAITSWNELYDLVDSLAGPPFALEPAQVAAIKANANPNLVIAQLNPDRVNNIGWGKADLTGATTELSFMTMGVYEIQSLGQVLDADGVVVAEAKLTAVAGVYDVMRITSQAGFERAARTVEAAGTFPNATERLGPGGASVTGGYVQLVSDGKLFDAEGPGFVTGQVPGEPVPAEALPEQPSAVAPEQLAQADPAPPARSGAARPTTASSPRPTTATAGEPTVASGEATHRDAATEPRPTLAASASDLAEPSSISESAPPVLAAAPVEVPVEGRARGRSGEGWGSERADEAHARNLARKADRENGQGAGRGGKQKELSSEQKLARGRSLGAQRRSEKADAAPGQTDVPVSGKGNGNGNGRANAPAAADTAAADAAPAEPTSQVGATTILDDGSGSTGARPMARPIAPPPAPTGGSSGSSTTDTVSLPKSNPDGPDGVRAFMTDAEADVLADRGGALFPDGVHQSRAKRRAYDLPVHAVAIEEGSIGFWFKNDRDDSGLEIPLLTVTTPLVSDAGVQMNVVVALDGDTLRVRSERLFYQRSVSTADQALAGAADDAACAAPAVPFRFVRTLCAGAMPGLGVANEWHHVSVSWWDGTDHAVHIDGKAVPVVIKQSGDAPMTGRAPYEPTFRVGGTVERIGASRLRDVTIDEVSVRPFAIAPEDQPPPERFASASGSVVGRFAGRFPAFSEDVRLGTLTWTELLPEGYAGRRLADGAIDAKLGLVIRGVEFAEREDGVIGADVPPAADGDAGLPPGARGRVNQLFAGARSRSHQAIAEAHHALALGGSPETVEAVRDAQIDAIMAETADAVAALERELGLPGGTFDWPRDLADGAPDASLAASGRPVEEVLADAIDASGGGSSASGGAGGPGILFAGESVEFSVRFTYERGPGAPPLNVSPVLEDVTLTYAGKLRIISSYWEQ